MIARTQWARRWRALWGIPEPLDPEKAARFWKAATRPDRPRPFWK